MQSVEYFIARRTASSDSRSRTSIMTRIATATVALGVAAMVLTLAVVNGFREQIYADLRGFSGDVRVMDVASLSGVEEPLSLSEEFMHEVAQVEGVEWIAPYIVVGGMARSGENLLGIQLKGVGSQYNTEWWQSRVVEGRLPDIKAAQRGKEIMLSRTTAAQLALGVGDRVEMLFIQDEERPRRDLFKVVGLYHTGFEEMDRMVALCDERDVRRVGTMPADYVSGYDIAIDNMRSVERVSTEVDEVIFQQAQSDKLFISALAATLQMRHPIAFDWMQAHTVIARSVILIMMVVLLFNMAAAILIMVFDRIGMIGALKAQGMRTGSIRHIFLYRAALIFVRGAVWGNLVGGVLAFVQWKWHIVELNPTGYMLSVLPISVGWWWLWLNLLTLAVAVVVMTLPSMLVARIKPERMLRYKL